MYLLLKELTGAAQLRGKRRSAGENRRQELSVLSFIAGGYSTLLQQL